MSLSTCESGQRPFEWVFLLLCLIPVACSQDVTSTLELAAAPGLTLPGSAVALGGIPHGSSFVYWDDLALYDSDGRTLCAEGGTLAARSEAGRIHYLTVTGVVGEVADEMLAWGGVGVFHLPPGYLQIIADRRGDERIMVIFDESGQQVRQNRLTAAWGVLSASPGGKLLAVRRTDVLEVLPYNWAWHGPVP